MASAKNISQAVLDDCWNRIGVHGDRSCAELEGHIHCRNCPVFSAAARTLLDVPAPTGSGRIATEHFAQAEQGERGIAAGADTQSVIVFRLRAEWYAIRAAVSQEIADLRPIHSLPHRRDGAVLGVANVGGGLLVCIALTVILGVAAQPERGVVPRCRVYWWRGARRVPSSFRSTKCTAWSAFALGISRRFPRRSPKRRRPTLRR